MSAARGENEGRYWTKFTLVQAKYSYLVIEVEMYEQLNSVKKKKLLVLGTII